MQLHPDCPKFLVWDLALMPDETALAFKRRADAVKAGEIVGMVEASAGKPPLTEEEQAAREAEKASDMRILCALYARAQTIEEKWAEPDKGAKRPRIVHIPEAEVELAPGGDGAGLSTLVKKMDMDMEAEDSKSAKA